MGNSEVSLKEGATVELRTLGCAGWVFVKKLGNFWIDSQLIVYCQPTIWFDANSGNGFDSCKPKSFFIQIILHFVLKFFKF